MINLMQNHQNTPDNPLSILFACHQKISRFCLQLSALPDYLQANGVDEMLKRDVAQIIRYFTVAAPLHHMDESEDLFPALILAHPDSKTIIQQLLAEHDLAEKAWQDLHKQLLFLDKQNDWQALYFFVQLYQNHMEIEETVFHTALQVLPEDALVQIEKAMRSRRMPS